ncbi:hypothetical protein [Pseudorhodoferax sp.]|uniref:hypothetical protein n=1 Tax=Pseudorhodoferax sp. TaxID=1993553 RepID=UPI0039E690FB
MSEIINQTAISERRRLRGAPAAALKRPGIPAHPVLLHAALALQGKALRAIPAALRLAPLDAAEPAMPDRPKGRCRKGSKTRLPIPVA